MRQRKVNIHHKAEFLNRKYHHTDATIISQITVTGSKDYVSSDCMLQIRDCHKAVNLSIDYGGAAGFANGRYKIRKLINHLIELEQAYTEGYEVYKQIKAEMKPKYKD